jgi:hypothetical protein
VTSAWTIETQDEYMDEEHSDECMDDTLVYMSRANAIRANNMSATNMCAARNIVTSGVNTIPYEERSDDTIIKDQPKAKANHKKYPAVALKRTKKVAIIKRGP